MAQLGLKLEAELAQLDAGEGLSAELAGRWGAEETARERSQWRPVRSVQMSKEQAGIATARVADIEDVENFLVDLGTVCSPACVVDHCLAAAVYHEAACASQGDTRAIYGPFLLLYPHQAEWPVLQT